MNVRKFSIKRWLPVVLGLLLTLPTSGLLAQDTRLDNFYSIDDLKRLIQVARESGFTESEIREITIEFNGELINAWDFLQEMERQRLEAQRRVAEEEAKQFLTIQDIFADLDTNDQQETTQLRDNLLFLD